MSGSQIALQAGAGIPDAPNALDTIGKFVNIGNAAAQNRLYNIAGDQRQQDLGKSNMAVSSSIAAAALAKAADIDFTNADTTARTAAPFVHALHDGLAHAVAIGAMDKSIGQQLIDQIAATTDIHDLVRRTKQFAQIGLDTNTSLGRTYGTMGVQANGQQVQPGIISDPMNPRPFQPVGAPVEQVLTPAQGATQTPSFRDGKPVTVPLSSLVTPKGTEKPTIPGNGTYTGGGGAGGNPTGPAMGEAETLKANQEAFRTAQADVPAAYQRVQSLTKAKEALNLALTTGPGSAGINKFMSFLNTVGISPKLGTDMAADYELLKKYTMEYATSTGSRGGTDKSLDAALSSNASPEISRAAANDVLNTNIGRERLSIYAANNAPDSEGKGFLKHRADIYSKMDPMAFALDQFDPAHMKAYRASLKGPALKRFNDGLVAAAKEGYIPQ